MKDVDFLPVRFRERDRLRRVIAWRIAATVLLAAAVLAAQMLQLAMRRSVTTQLAQVAAPFAEATATSARLERLRSDLQSQDQLAALYTYLDHPWPRSQLLSAIAQTLPGSLALTEVRIAPRTPTKKNTAPPARDSASKSAPAVADLQALHDEHDGNTTEIVIRGIATDTAMLQDYVAGFTRSPLFSSAKLSSIESLKEKRPYSGSQFELWLIVRPGYGQPGGPEPPSSRPPSEPQAMLRPADAVRMP